jgi:hypothetical protein
MKLEESMRVDGQSIGIVRDKQTSAYVDYFFEADLWYTDPRFQSRFMKIGICRGLFRFDKETLSAELLFPMVGDEAGRRFNNAASKVLKEFRSTRAWPEITAFASG